MKDLFIQWAFANDAMQLALVGVGFVVLAGFALLMEWLRGRNRSLERLEKVGWVPWTPIFLGCAFIGGGCLAMSLPIVLGGA